MPAPRAILHDVHTKGLKIDVEHNVISATGMIKARVRRSDPVAITPDVKIEQQHIEVVEPVVIEPVVVPEPVVIEPPLTEEAQVEATVAEEQDKKGKNRFGKKQKVASE